MTIMGATLVSITSGDIRANNEKDLSQQAFYAAESGISDAKKWMKDNANTLTTSSQRNLNNDLLYCKAAYFPNLNTANGFIVGRKTLNEVISSSDSIEAKRLSKFSLSHLSLSVLTITAIIHQREKNLVLIKHIILFILVDVMVQKALAEVKITKLYLWRQW